MFERKKRGKEEKGKMENLFEKPNVLAGIFINFKCTATSPRQLIIIDDYPQ